MNMLINATVLAAAALLAANSACAAGYLKFEGVDGESSQVQPITPATHRPGAQPRPVPAPADRLAQPEQAQALLLPAVQAAREAARRSQTSAP